MWKRLAERPGGPGLFSATAMVRVPYFASIVPHVVRMEPGFAEVTVPTWFFLKSVEQLAAFESDREGAPTSHLTTIETAALDGIVWFLRTTARE